MASSTVNRWLRPEVYPLFAAVGVAVGICGFQLIRNICTNPEVRMGRSSILTWGHKRLYYSREVNWQDKGPLVSSTCAYVRSWIRCSGNPYGMVACLEKEGHFTCHAERFLILTRFFFCIEIPRVTKENRAAGVLDNFDEGEKYSQHFVRRFVRNKSPEIMPSINSFFSDPKL
ncbi:hypothetical protein RJ639_009268 [Escallonia herrerae]|uniref:Uncharacterized protein n=1 Tax=Escallonia herrerae TaxID=1293975 RepID=A0AA88VRB1_9ASTE|nr:hypothetical protein RJ639_009268 [Escallonia herrerae]